MSNVISRFLPALLTVAVVLMSFVLVWQFRQLDELNKIGGFVAGISGALASIWLVAAYRLQSHELRLQREELALQRSSLDAQRDELRKMGKYAALEQMAKIMTQFEESMARMPAGAPTSIGEIPSSLHEGMKLWKTILESNDNQQIHDLYMRWQRTVSPAQEFLARFLSAVELYEEAVEAKLLAPGDDHVVRTYVSIDAIRTIPFLRNYSGTAELVATELFMFQPGLDAIQLRGLEATDALMPGVVKKEALQALREKVQAHKESKGTAAS